MMFLDPGYQTVDPYNASALLLRVFVSINRKKS